MILRKVRFIVTVAFGILLAPLSSGAQQSTKGPRIGFLSLSSPSAAAPYLEAFRHALREVGYVEGQNIGFEFRWAEGTRPPAPGFRWTSVTTWRLRFGLGGESAR